jgi:hypothetical protein
MPGTLYVTVSLIALSSRSLDASYHTPYGYFYGSWLALPSLVEQGKGGVVGTSRGPRKRHDCDEAVAAVVEERVGVGEIAARCVDQRRDRCRQLAHAAAVNWSRHPAAQA